MQIPWINVHVAPVESRDSLNSLEATRISNDTNKRHEHKMTSEALRVLSSSIDHSRQNSSGLQEAPRGRSALNFVLFGPRTRDELIDQFGMFATPPTTISPSP